MIEHNLHCAILNFYISSFIFEEHVNRKIVRDIVFSMYILISINK